MKNMPPQPRAKTIQWPTFVLISILVFSLLPIQAAQGAAYTIQYDPIVAALIAQVQPDTLYAYVANLSGVQPVTIGGADYTIGTRHTNSGTPIQKATQYVYEYLQGLPGLDSVSYDDWTASIYSSRNVVGALTGFARPDEIVLLTAHIDDMPSGALAPGADDNASGSAALMVAAQVLSQYSFERTIRFVFFTGEEQGLYGSKDYAAAAAALGENIVAVINMDMLGWEGNDNPTMRIHTRAAPAGAGDLEIADVFVAVAQTYALGLTPIIDSDGLTASDHYPFWARGYSAILVIEDDDADFNPYYHTINDTLARVDMPYFTALAAASVGSIAHLAFIDSSPVVLSSLRAGSNPTGAASVNYTVTFSEPVTGVDATDFALAAAGVTAANVTNISSPDGVVYTVTVATGSGNGSLRLDVLDDDTIVDSIGNPLGGGYTSGETYTIDKSVSTVIYTSTGAQDGWVLESSEISNRGGTLNATATVLRLGDTAARKQYLGLLSFRTGPGLPDHALITKVTLKVKQQGIVGGGNPVTAFQGLLVDIKKGYFGPSAALAVADFQAPLGVIGKTFGPYKPALSGGWYSLDLTAAKDYLNKLSTPSGLTQIRLHFKLDDNNDATANYLSLYSGNAPAASQPQLIVEYYFP